ncbi:MAG: histidinol-phosphate transaminase [Proteobacteria bacterium]|jgi:histidinol-phosphate aminotransferase|nr:histidinol-phosphate transaminase [Pseudomonadota bacterium]
MSKFWNDRVNALTPYVPGEQTRDATLLKLNTNESPYGTSPLVLQEITSATDGGLSLYPDPTARLLRESIGKFYSLDAEQVFVGNGSDEVLAHIFGGLFSSAREVLSPEITYGFYPIYCRYFGLEYRAVPLLDDFSIDVRLFNAKEGHVGGIIIANPNAATGIALELEDIRHLLEVNSDIVVVVDEAYVDFGAESAITLLSEYSNLLVVQTCSKSRGLAGMRIGLALGSVDLIEALIRMKDSFNSYPLDKLAQVGAAAAFGDTAYFDKTRNKVIATRESFRARILMAGYDVVPSKANFLLVRHPFLNGADFAHQLRLRGILVRHLSGEKLLLYVRISIGTDEQMDHVVEVFLNLISQLNDG